MPCVVRFIAMSTIAERTPHVLENYNHIIDAAYEGWNKLNAMQNQVKSIGTRDWAYVGRCL